MTSTGERIEHLAYELGFKPDPGFNGELALYSESGRGAVVIAFDYPLMFLQVYRLDGPGDDFEMVRTEEHSIRAEWAEFGYVTAERRIHDLVAVLELDALDSV